MNGDLYYIFFFCFLWLELIGGKYLACFACCRRYKHHQIPMATDTLFVVMETIPWLSWFQHEERS